MSKEEGFFIYAVYIKEFPCPRAVEKILHLAPHTTQKYKNTTPLPHHYIIVHMPIVIHYSVLVFYQPQNPDAALYFVIYPTYLQRFIIHVFNVHFTILHIRQEPVTCQVRTGAEDHAGREDGIGEHY